MLYELFWENSKSKLLWDQFLKLRIFEISACEELLSEQICSTSHFDKNHKKMTHLKLIQNHSRKVPRGPGHQKTSWNIILTDPGPSGKNSKIRQKLVILRSFGSFSSCWRMCCPAGGLEGKLKWLGGDPYPPQATRGNTCVSMIHILCIFVYKTQRWGDEGLGIQKSWNI